MATRPASAVCSWSALSLRPTPGRRRTLPAIVSPIATEAVISARATTPEAREASHQPYCGGSGPVMRRSGRVGKSQATALVDRPDQLHVSVVVDEHAAGGAQDPSGAGRSGEERRLGQGLGLERAGGERGRGEHARPRGPAGGRVDEVVRVAAVGRAPQADVEAGRGHRSPAEVEPVDDLAAERMVHIDLERAPRGLAAADAHVARAIDGKARQLTDQLGDRVGRKPLADAAGVEPGSGRPPHATGSVVDRPAAPTRGGVRPRRTPGRRDGECRAKRSRLGVAASRPVPGRLELVEQGGIDEPGRLLCRPQAGAHGGPEQPGRWRRRARVGVEPRQLAVGPEARQARVEVAQPALRGGTPCGRVRALQQEADLAAHAGERCVVGFGHEDRVATGGGAGAGAGAAPTGGDDVEAAIGGACRS